MFRAPNPPYEPPQTRDWSISNPAAVFLFGGAPSLAGVTVSEQTVLGIPAVKAAVSLIAGSIASLPLQTITEQADGTNKRVPSMLDDPGKVVGLTCYEWKEIVVAHLLIHGNAFLIHVRGGAGQLVGLQPIHPAAVGVEIAKDGSKRYRVSMRDGTTRDYTDANLTHIPWMPLDGIRGWSPLQLARSMFGTSIAAERSAARLFGNGALMSAVVTPEDTLTAEEAAEIKASLEKTAAGEANAGAIAVINRKFKMTPWSLSNADAQWLEARAFQIEEIARWFGVPPHLLAQTEKQTSWGTGVAEQNLGLARYNLEPWTTRIQERLSWLLGPNQKAEFFYSAFVEPDPETEIQLLIAQVEAGLITPNEARKVRNLPPIEGGDVLRTPQPPQGNTP
ncbi:phage portal protein [Mycobacterium aquaticum]|uniref:Phage portal protein n=2 Tax=Mycobacterium aquaticum TaxID=1927124 RepID=A0A1X0B8T6_9MYCO|nr:phage portal protein [Mycobacterium aquaticum]